MRITSHIAGADTATLHEDKLDAAVKELKDKNPGLSEWLEQALPIYRLFGETGDAVAVNELMHTTTNAQDDSVQQTLVGISGLPAEPALAPGRAMQAYKVTIGNQKDGKALSGDEWILHLLEIRKSVLTAMLPYFETGQFGKIDMLPANREKDKYNISFYATTPAARVAAAKLQPYECTLTDSKGVAVEPAVLPPPAEAPSVKRTPPQPN
jgi:hypothetical protein